ncbi:oligogalacturonate lyase family protein [Halobacteria archaeon AArc-m2/3/4]|uniref:Oligogalacturonate lyase family protein n=1 Tax=Natronoglomus mannanivorans TaxID=2979990 RepID=A0ABT2QKB2_9EURY|nr:oligogalacturonate lyase family protein [Halobacteria archaeon AArc-m2/3/4]
MEAELLQGPDAGRQLAAERETFEDPETGATVHRLTSDPDSDDYHLYFTEPMWYDDGNRLLFRSDRDGTWGLYSVHLESGAITQLTDLPEDIGGITRVATEPTALFWCGRRLVSLDLETLAIDVLYVRPEGYGGSVIGGTADGERAVTAISEEIEVERENRPRDEWIAELMAQEPHSQVLSVPIDADSDSDGDSDSNGEPTVHVDENRWLNHVNASPTRPELVTYCEEGPWEDVDRIWGLDLETDETWQIRPTAEGESVGHEYWLADGETVGYHGWQGTRDDPDAFFGQIRHDNTDRREGTAPDIYTHYHSNTRDLVVGDGTHRTRGPAFVLLWAWDEATGEYAPPRKLAGHEWESDEDAHPHSRLSPDGTHVVFDSTMGGDGSDVYLAAVPDDLEDLPRLS